MHISIKEYIFKKLHVFPTSITIRYFSNLRKQSQWSAHPTSSHNPSYEAINKYGFGVSNGTIVMSEACSIAFRKRQVRPPKNRTKCPMGSESQHAIESHSSKRTHCNISVTFTLFCPVLAQRPKLSSSSGPNRRRGMSTY
jgi:hypothetical protein